MSRDRGRRARWIAGGALGLVLAIGVWGCRTATVSPHRGEPVAQSFGPAERAAYVESFDEVWRIVRDQHYDPSLNGVDWEGARAELRPRVETAGSADEARGVMSALLARLGESHFAIIPGEAYRTLEDEGANNADGAGESRERASGRNAELGSSSSPESLSGRAPGWHGVQLRERGGAIVVTRIEPGSPAGEAGLRPGDVVERIGRSELAPLLEAARTAAGSGPSRVDTLSAMFAEGRLDGRAGETRRVAVRGEDGSTRELEFVLTDEAGPESRLMSLPPMATRFASRDLGDGVAYLTFTTFLDPGRIMPLYNGVVQDLIDTEGDHGALVIDLRGNLGGLMPMVNGMCGWFVDEATTFGELRIRGTNLRAIANPRWETFNGPVAVLIDEVSISSAEIMAAGLQDMGRARLFGARTAGLALPSQFVRLPSGDGLQFVFADYVRSNGLRLEAEGVAPDEEILARPTSGDPDPVLSAALAWIEGERSVEAGVSPQR